MYGVLILKQFDGDTKIGPLGWSQFDEVNGWRVSDSNYKHEIEYEFAMAYYWNIALRRASNVELFTLPYHTWRFERHI